jgi:type IV secretory pathway TrbD component
VNNFFKSLTRLVLRLGLLLAALVFLASLLLAGGLVLVIWLVRGLWAKLTGQPVQPWVFKMHRTDLWQRAYRASAPASSRSKAPMDVIDAEVREVPDVSGVSDIQQKRP